MKDDKIIKKRIYTLILSSFFVFFLAAKTLKPYESNINDLSVGWIVVGMLLFAALALLLELIIFKIFMASKGEISSGE